MSIKEVSKKERQIKGSKECQKKTFKSNAKTSFEKMSKKEKKK